MRQWIITAFSDKGEFVLREQLLEAKKMKAKDRLAFVTLFKTELVDNVENPLSLIVSARADVIGYADPQEILKAFEKPFLDGLCTEADYKVEFIEE